MDFITKPTVVRKYEAVILMHPDADEDQQKELFQKNKDIVESFGGEVNHVDTWGRRRLANQVKDLRNALYFHTTFCAKPEVISELERTMGINDRVIRVMHTRLEDNTDLKKFVDQFKENLADTAKVEKDREEKFKQKRQKRL